ncbi:MAG: MMPL family transporter, partial [Chitinivibrionales bacterium]|nr:MMPL family transporter [Chitinivibrionales bacterium]
MYFSCFPHGTRTRVFPGDDCPRQSLTVMKSIADRTIGFILRFRVAILVGLLMLTALFGAFIPRIEVNNDPRSTIPEGLEELVAYRQLQQTFNTPRSILLIAEFDSSRSLTAKIDSMTAWARQFEDIDGIDRAFHLGSIKVPVKGGLLGMTTQYVVRTGGDSVEARLRERIRANEAFTGAFISQDEHVLGMLLSVDESRRQSDVARRVRQLQSRLNEDGGARILVTGAPLYTSAIDRAMRRDFALLLPLCLVVVFALLYWVFRRTYYVVCSLGIIAVSLIWTFGLMGMLGVSFSVVTAMTPVILFPIGVASAIHVFRTYARNRQAQPSEMRETVIKATFHELLKPIFLSAITTFFGFASFSFSKTIWTRNFGIFTGIGVALALLFSIVLLPIVLYYDRKDCARLAGESTRSRLLPAGFWPLYERFVLTSYRWVGLGLLVVVVGVVGFLQVRIEGNPITMFREGSEIRQADELIGKHLGGTRFLHVVLTHKEHEVTMVEDWAEVDEIVRYLNADTLVGASTSLLPLMKRVSGLLTDEVLSTAGVSMVVGGKGLLGRSFGSYIDSWVSPDKRSVKITLMCRNVSGTPYVAFAERIRDHVQKRYPAWEVLVAGPPMLNDAMTFLLIDTQVSSLLLAFGCVFLVLCLL